MKHSLSFEKQMNYQASEQLLQSQFLGNIIELSFSNQTQSGVLSNVIKSLILMKELITLDISYQKIGDAGSNTIDQIDKTLCLWK